jgi:hypothetical protein
MQPLDERNAVYIKLGVLTTGRRSQPHLLAGAFDLVGTLSQKFLPIFYFFILIFALPSVDETDHPRGPIGS